MFTRHLPKNARILHYICLFLGGGTPFPRLLCLWLGPRPPPAKSGPNHAKPLQEISSKSVHNFFSCLTDRQIDRQTDQTKNITSFGGDNNVHWQIPTCTPIEQPRRQGLRQSLLLLTGWISMRTSMPGISLGPLLLRIWASSTLQLVTSCTTLVGG